MDDGYSFRWTPKGEQFKKAVDELGRLVAVVGYQRGKATHKTKVKGKDGKEKTNNVDMVDIACWNEFGTSRAPARPFLRQSIENHTDEIKESLENACKMVLDGASAKQAISMVGAAHVGRVQETMVNGDFVPNSPATIVAKGSDKPLIDTGQLRQSVHFEVREE